MRIFPTRAVMRSDFLTISYNVNGNKKIPNKNISKYESHAFVIVTQNRLLSLIIRGPRNINASVLYEKRGIFFDVIFVSSFLLFMDILYETLFDINRLL